MRTTAFAAQCIGGVPLYDYQLGMRREEPSSPARGFIESAWHLLAMIVPCS